MLLPEPPCHTLVTCSKRCHHPTRNNEYSDLSRASHARVYTSYEMESHARQQLLYAVAVRPKSLYEDVHAYTVHPSYIGMRRHQQNTIGANYTDKDAAVARGICQGCALGSAHQYPTLVNSSSSSPSPIIVLDPPDSSMLTSSQISHPVKFIQSSPSPSLSRSSLLAWLSYFIHALNGSQMDQLLTARSRKLVISQLSLQSTVTVSAIVVP